jgi:hypothetical protein
MLLVRPAPPTHLCDCECVVEVTQCVKLPLLTFNSYKELLDTLGTEQPAHQHCVSNSPAGRRVSLPGGHIVAYWKWRPELVNPPPLSKASGPMLPGFQAISPSHQPS